MALTVLDPTGERTPPLGQLARRPHALAGKTIGIISNGKEGAAGFFGHFGRMLQAELGVADVVTRVKSNFSAPADRDVIDEIARWQAVVTGVGD